MPFRSVQKTVLVSGILVALFMFGNCSEVSFTPTDDIKSRLVCDDNGSCILKGQSDLTAGLNLPPLKLFFVVDNSYTMKANQFNLSSSFQQMFDVNNSSNLMPFETDAYLFNTAQYSYRLNSAQLNSLRTQLVNADDVLTINYEKLVELHRPENKPVNGLVPGDVLGYSINELGGVTTFMPAPVVGRNIAGPTAISILNTNMRKSAGVSAALLSTEFQARLGVINPDRNPDNFQSTRLWPEPLDNESGMCAMARILKHSAKYLANSDQSVFVVVSDEDEADLSGANCIDSTYKTNEAVVDLACREVRSTLTLSDQNCRGKYGTGYNVEYQYQEANVPIGISYRQALSTNYPRTTMLYEQVRYREKRTRVTYQLKSCIVRDGVTTNECTYSQQVKDVAGDQSGNCAAVAQSLSGNSAVLIAPYAPTCQFLSTQWFDLNLGSSCTESSTCEKFAEAASPIANVKGNYTDATACWNYVLNQNRYAAPGSARCSLVTAVTGDTGTLSCSGIPGCVANFNGARTINNSQLTCPTGTTPKVGSRDIIECQVEVGTATRTSTTNVSFRDGFLQGAQLANNAVCSAELGQEIYKISKNNLFRPGVDRCLVKATNYSSLTSLTLTGGLSCSQAADQLCSQNAGTRRFCVADSSPKTATIALNEKLDCSSTCASSKTNACNSIAGSTPTSKIADLVAAQAGMSSGYLCSAPETYTAVNGLRTVPAANATDAMCEPVQGRMTYIDPTRTTQPYNSDRPVIEFVSGTKRLATGEYVPNKDLAAYIVSRSQELFGTGFKPIFSTFVRQATDGNGTGGSIGNKYIALSSQMSGQNTSVVSGDYATPLRDLSRLIRERVQRVMTVPGMKPDQVVHEVFYQSKKDPTWKRLDATDYTAFSSTVRLSDNFIFEEGDHFRFIFW